MFTLFPHDNIVHGFGRWLYWHYKERGVFAVGNCQAHAFNKYRAFEKVHVFTGRIGGRNTDILGRFIRWNCKVKMIESRLGQTEWHSFKASSREICLSI